MPLTKFQTEIVKLLAVNRSPDSHLAGGAAIILHLEPNSKRYSNDLDYFHDSEARVATAYEQDRSLLTDAGFEVEVEMSQPGYVRAVVSKKKVSTKLEWAYDSAWRFLPPVKHADCGYVLHPLDLAINKVLTLAGREEPRDLIDVLEVHQNILPLPALVWAAPGKDPGFNPSSLLSMLKRRGKYRREDFARLMLDAPIDPQTLKDTLATIYDACEAHIAVLPASDVGCLYWNKSQSRFVLSPWMDGRLGQRDPDVIAHFPIEGGVWPRVLPA